MVVRQQSLCDLGYTFSFGLTVHPKTGQVRSNQIFTGLLTYLYVNVRGAARRRAAAGRAGGDLRWEGNRSGSCEGWRWLHQRLEMVKEPPSEVK